MDSASSPSPTDHRVAVRYHGTGNDIFSLALRTGLLSLATLGFYRFWAKTRIRRYVWSGIEIDGARFEYTGTGLEKFLGFLVAVVLLAIYLGIIQMALFYFGITLFREPQSEAELLAQMGGFYVSLLAVVPFYYFAVYRARRFRLARTRWRGIRFGMEPAAWGYALRAVGYGVLTVVSLGLLLPLATFRLERYMTERSWFGDAKFEQGGRWQGLYAAMRHLLRGLALVVVAIAASVAGSIGAALLLLVVGIGWTLFGAVHYAVQSFAYLTSHKRLAGGISFASQPRTGTIIRIYLLGFLAIGLLSSILFGLVAAATAGPAMLDLQSADLAAPGGASLFYLVLGVVGYLVVLVGIGAGALALISQPVLAHYVDTITVINPAAISSITQRAHDDGADAEGFADALDVGGAF